MHIVSLIISRLTCVLHQLFAYMVDLIFPSFYLNIFVVSIVPNINNTVLLYALLIQERSCKSMPRGGGAVTVFAVILCV